MKERVLITGGAGFIGGHTAAALVESGYRVRVLDNLHPQIHGPGGRWPGYLHPDVERVLGDVRRTRDLARALDGSDYVFHFCAETGVGQSMEEVTRYYEVNVQGTACLFHCLRAARRRPKGLLLSSSRAVYGEGRRSCGRCRRASFPSMRTDADLRRRKWDPACPRCGGPTSIRPSREQDPANPCSTYALTKWQQEEMVRFYSTWLGIPWVILRYFNVYGPWQSPRNPYTGIVTLFMRLARAGRPIDVYEDGRPVRDFVYVADVVRANLTAVRHFQVRPGTFNIGSGHATTIDGLVDAIERAIGVRARRTRLGHYRVGDIRACVPDLSHARKELGLAAGLPLAEGLATLRDWLLEHAET